MGEVERHKDTAGALEAALARQSVTLAGVWSRPACRKEGLSMDAVRMRAHIANATDQVDRAVRAGLEHLYAMEWERGDWTLLTTGSVDAAEHVAKAVLTGYGLSPREVHFLDALAEQLASAYRGRDDARQTQWADRLRAMNGTTRARRLHNADCRRFVAPPVEPLERSVERTGQAQHAQILWLHEMVERWPQHAEEAEYATRAILRKGRLRPARRLVGRPGDRGRTHTHDDRPTGKEHRGVARGCASAARRAARRLNGAGRGGAADAWDG